VDRVSGAYTTKRDDGLRYQYEATWQTGDGDWMTWSATVTRDGAAAGTASGVVMRTLDMPKTIRELVCDAIERRAGVK